MLFNLADINYLENAFSKFSCFPALTLFPLKWIAPKENAVVIWSLFAGKNHVEIVLLNTLYFWATNDLVWPLSVSCNALNLSSMKVLFSFATCTSSFHCFNNKTRNWMRLVKPETFKISKSLKQLLISSFIGLKSFGSVKRFMDNTFERSAWIIPYFGEIPIVFMSKGKGKEMEVPCIITFNGSKQMLSKLKEVLWMAIFNRKKATFSNTCTLIFKNSA